MANNSATTPSVVFGYWRPWKEDSNLFDSYLNYAKDVSLSKYTADTVGKYISEASAQQIHAISELGQKIGMGMNVLSKQMATINQELFFVNRNLDILNEQQKISNLLLENIAELLRVPDIEKERNHCIELGLKFFVNAQNDADLYSDSLEELLKAESLMKQDYFVLHRIGLIYLHSIKHINPKVALDYFLRAAKYASIESDPKASRLVNVLKVEKTNPRNNFFVCEIILNKIGIQHMDVIRMVKELNRIDFNEAKELIENLPVSIKKGISYNDAKMLLNEINDIGAEAEIYSDGEKVNENDFDKKNAIENIKLLAAESYEKAAFASYILGDFEAAVKYQSNALKFDNNVEIQFSLAKYQARIKLIDLCIQNLDECIQEKPTMSLAVFKDLDLLNEPEVLALIDRKNSKLNEELFLIQNRWNEINSSDKEKFILELQNLKSLNYSEKYELKNKHLLELEKYKKNLKSFDSKIIELKKLMIETRSHLSKEQLIELCSELDKIKNQEFELALRNFEEIQKQYIENKLKIGDEYAGGVIIYLEKFGENGLVVAKEHLGEAVWGNNGIIETKEGVYNGYYNTKLIVEKYSNSFGGILKMDTAARRCINLNLNGYTDWYLPNSDEIRKIPEKTMKNFMHDKNKNCIDMDDNLVLWSSDGWNHDDGNSGIFAMTNYRSNGKYLFTRNSKARVIAIRKF